MDDDETRKQAIHECGHAIAGYKLFPREVGPAFDSVNTFPGPSPYDKSPAWCEKSAVFNWFPKDDRGTTQESDCTALMAIAFGGYCADILCGNKNPIATYGPDFHDAWHYFSWFYREHNPNECTELRHRCWSKAWELAWGAVDVKAVEILAEHLIKTGRLDWKEVNEILRGLSVSMTDEKPKSYVMRAEPGRFKLSGGGITIKLGERPARRYATQAAKWRDIATENDREPGFLALISSVFCAESFIIEQLVAQNTPCCKYIAALKLIPRWIDGTQAVCADTVDARRAAGEITTLCKDQKDFGLLVRARNQLVHPKPYERVVQGPPNANKGEKIVTLINDLRKTNPLGSISLPNDPPGLHEFVGHPVCARWATNTLGTMIRHFFQAADLPVDDWEERLESLSYTD